MGKNKNGTLFFSDPPCIAGRYAIAGRNESEGPLGKYFDECIGDALWGEDTFEKCERKLFMTAAENAAKRASMDIKNADVLLGGDLLDQIISAGYSARELGLPFLGLYGACSTYAEGLITASALIDGGFADNALCAVSSHFGACERQFRYPLELGTPKTPNSQNTVTGAAAALVSRRGKRSLPVITCATIGRVVDAGLRDANNMGAAMAPAAVETVITHLENTGTSVRDYDAIITGDLGHFGSRIFGEFSAMAGTDTDGRYCDCGAMIFRGCKNEYCGGSGCACGAVVMNSYFLPGLEKGRFSRILFAATGALLSPTSVLQKESIPCIAHALTFERRM